jgi:hypothetical protein
MINAEANDVDRSQRSSAGMMSTMPLRATIKGEDIELKEALLASREEQLVKKEEELRRILD